MDIKKNILAIRIKDLRTQLNLTQEELALKLGLKGKSSIANYEKGTITPSDEIKLKMCDVFDCSMDYLLGKTEFRTKKEELEYFIKSQYSISILETILKNYENNFILCGLKEEEDIDTLINLIINVDTQNSSEDYAKKIKTYINSFPNDKRKHIKKLIINILNELNFREKSLLKYHNLVSYFEKNSDITPLPTNNLYMCPVYGKISAGLPNWAEECLESRIPIDPTVMNIYSPEECFFLRVSGESMNKVIRNGGYALIRKQEDVENGEIAVVLVNGFDATLKKFTKKNDMVILEPMSNDPSYEIQIYDKTTPIQIIGKYIGKFEMN